MQLKLRAMHKNASRVQVEGNGDGNRATNHPPEANQQRINFSINWVLWVSSSALDGNAPCWGRASLDIFGFQLSFYKFCTLKTYNKNIFLVKDLEKQTRK